VVVEAEYARAGFLHAAGDLGLHVAARLKANLPELSEAVQQRFRRQPPTLTLCQGKDRIEIWDADDFDPWQTLRWTTVRVLCYRQHKASGEVVEAYGLTDFPARRLSSRTLFQLAKSRWEIENQVQRRQESSWPGAHLPSSLQQPAADLAAHRPGFDRRASLPSPLPAPGLASGAHRDRSLLPLRLSLSSPAALDSS
jgi:hypothetical protein